MAVAKAPRHQDWARQPTSETGRKQACRLAGGRSARLCIMLCGLYGLANQSNWLERRVVSFGRAPKVASGLDRSLQRGQEREAGRRQRRKEPGSSRIPWVLSSWVQRPPPRRSIHPIRMRQQPPSPFHHDITQELRAGVGPGASEGFVQFEPSLETPAASSSSSQEQQINRKARGTRSYRDMRQGPEPRPAHLAPAPTHCCRDRC